MHRYEDIDQIIPLRFTQTLINVLNYIIVSIVGYTLNFSDLL